MKITVIGTGYVGLVTGACLSDVGIEVTCVDIDQKKIDGLKNGILPIYEPGLKEIVERNYAKGRLNFSTDLSEAIQGSAAAFIAGYPSRGRRLCRFEVRTCCGRSDRKDHDRLFGGDHKIDGTRGYC